MVLDGLMQKQSNSNRMKDNLKVPHMGWNYVIVKKNSKLFKDMYDNPRFYFVHSYYVSV